MTCGYGRFGRCGQCGCLLETLDRVRAMPVPKDEETAKVKIILPVLAALGWDPAGVEVIVEYQVGAVGARGRGKRFVDIALAPEPERPVALIEAKAPRQDLGRNVNQVLQQAFFGTAEICVLTNGLGWWFYLPRAAGNPEDRRFAELRLDSESLEDPDSMEEAAADLKAFLGRDALIGGSAARRARQVLAAREHPDLLTEQLAATWKALAGHASADDPHPELVKLIRRLAYERIGLRPTPQQIADLLRDWSGGEPDGPDDSPPPTDPPLNPGPAGPPDTPPKTPPPPAPVPAGPPDTPPETPPPPAAVDPPHPKAEETAAPYHLVEDGELLVPSSAPLPGSQPIAIGLWDQRHRTRRAYDIPVRVAQLLLDRYPDDYLDMVQHLPKIVGSSKRAGMLRPKPIRKAGRIVWYVNPGSQRSVLVKNARRILGACSHNPDELWLIYKATDATQSPKAPASSRSSAKASQSPHPTRPAKPQVHKLGERAPKPAEFVLWGARHPVKHWYQVLVGVAEAVYGRHPDDFDRIGELGPAYARNSRKEPSGRRKHRRVNGTDWWLDTNYRSELLHQHARDILRHFGEPDDLAVYGSNGESLP